MPEDGEEVLFYSPAPVPEIEIHFGYYSDEYDDWVSFGSGDMDRRVTHWMRPPDGPVKKAVGMNAD